MSRGMSEAEPPLKKVAVQSLTNRGGPELTLRASLYFFSRLPFVLMVYNFVDFTNIVAMDTLIC